MTWLYQKKEFTSDMIEDNIGFVYCIIDKTNGMKYIGKKTLVSKRKLPPLKGKSRRRIKVAESDWKTYYGSSKEVMDLVEQYGGDRFERHILRLCKTKGEMSYYELEEQVTQKVLFKPDEYYNAFIGCKIHRNHVLTNKEK